MTRLDKNSVRFRTSSAERHQVQISVIRESAISQHSSQTTQIVCYCCLIMHETLRQIPSHCTHKVHTQRLVDWRQRRLPSSTCDKHKHYSKQPAGLSFAFPRGSTPRAVKGQREQTSVRKLNAAVQEVINRRLSQLTEIVSPALSPLAKLKRKWGAQSNGVWPRPGA